MGRVPRARPNRSRLPRSEQARLEHDRATARARELPVDAILDGELVALGDDEWPDLPSVCERLLNGNRSIPLIYIVFDVLEHDGRSTTHSLSGSVASWSTG